MADNSIHPGSNSRTPSINSARTESSDDSLAGTLAALTGGGAKPPGEHRIPGSSMSDSGHGSARTSCPESQLLQRNQNQRRRGHRTPPFYYEHTLMRSESHGGRRKSSLTALDDPMGVLNDSTRFAQENYECSFCSIEEPTFEKLLDHISNDHPWYDLSMHRSIR